MSLQATATRAFYNTLNPLMRMLLRSPIHGVASRNLGILHYRGRRSNRPYETPLSYVRDGRIVRFLTSHNTRWWLNFRGGPTPAEVEIAGEMLSGVGRLFVEDSEALRDGVRQFLTALPRDAPVYGIRLDAKKRPLESEIENLEGRVILVEVECALLAQPLEDEPQ